MKNGKFEASVTTKGTRIRLGRHATAKEAAKIRDIYVIKHEIKAKLNFPLSSYDIQNVEDVIPTSRPNTIQKQPNAQPKSKTEYVSAAVSRLIVENRPDDVVLIDSNVVEKVCVHKWYVTKRSYVRTTLPKGPKVELHRFLMEEPEGVTVDHIDRNRLNNTMQNLRIVTRADNSKNKSLSDSHTSQYRGVQQKGNGKYIARVANVYVGSFDSEITAAMEHDRYVINKGHHMIELNFPEIREKLVEENYVVPKREPVRPKVEEYNGVEYRKGKGTNNKSFDGKHYKAFYKTNKERITIWESDDPKECAMKWDEYIVENGLKNKSLNFPELHPTYGIPTKTKTNYKPHSEGVYRLVINNAPDVEVLIDQNQYDKIRVHNWTYMRPDGRIIAKIGTLTMKLNRFIMGETDPDVSIKFISKDKLDYRVTNLMKVKKK